MKILTFPLAAIVTLLVIVPRSARAQSFSGPHCLGPYCIGQPVLADRFVSEIEEPGNKISFWRFLAVYRSKDGSACLDVREAPEAADKIASITLQATSRCPGEISKKNLADWKTPEGIGLRSPEQDVLRAYGKPSEEPERAWGLPSACSKAKPFSYIGILKGSAEGIRLGSSEQDVLKAYGKPPKESKFMEGGPHFEIAGFQDGDKLPDVADNLITYDGFCGIGRAEFGRRAGRVSYIWFPGQQ
jgi:hypothetical protein